jgi:3',5'-cyclic AMP phosphodiesterase CpdA
MPAPEARILHITDTHLGDGDEQGAANWAIVARLAAALKPDLVVHTGDLMLHDPASATDRQTGHEALLSLGLPFRVTPGNHDVGDSPSADPVFGQVVDRRWTRAWCDTFGADRWHLDLGAWTVAGLNAMLFGTGWEEEAAQWDWLEGLLRVAAPRPVALFMHKPPYLLRFDEMQDDAMAIPAMARARLRRIASGSTLRLIGCGHRHEHRHYAGGPEEPAVVWAPPVSFIGTRSPPVLDVPPHPGCVLHSFLGETVISQVIAPPDMARFDVSFLYRLREAQHA